MAGRLVTVATFDGPTRAQMARDALEAAGIPAVLADDMTVTLFWHLSNAVGGIKVQVREEEAERAVEVLERELGPAPEGAVDEAALAAEAEAAAREDEVEHDLPPDRPVEPAGEPAGEPPPAPGSRDEYARRLYFAALFGMLVLPLWFYALYLLLNAAFGEGELTPRGRRHLLVGGAVLAVGLPPAVLITSFVLGV
jgi:hypothetical protein